MNVTNFDLFIVLTIAMYIGGKVLKQHIFRDNKTLKKSSNSCFPSTKMFLKVSEQLVIIFYLLKK